MEEIMKNIIRRGLCLLLLLAMTAAMAACGPKNTNTDADEKTMVYAVEAGSAGEDVAKEKGWTVNSVQDQAAALMEVASGTSDAAIIDLLMAGAMIGEADGVPFVENGDHHLFEARMDEIFGNLPNNGVRDGSPCAMGLFVHRGGERLDISRRARHAVAADDDIVLLVPLHVLAVQNPLAGIFVSRLFLFRFRVEHAGAEQTNARSAHRGRFQELLTGNVLRHVNPSFLTCVCRTCEGGAAHGCPASLL